MNRVRVVLLLACGLCAGCGGNTAPPPAVDAAAEQEDAEQVRKANAAEGRKPKGKPQDE
jgi:hypothetical protein